MFVYSHILSTFLTGFVFLLQISFNQASRAKPKPSASVQVTQTFILPFYLKSKPLSEKKLVFRKALSSFPFSEKKSQNTSLRPGISGADFWRRSLSFRSANCFGTNSRRCVRQTSWIDSFDAAQEHEITATEFLSYGISGKCLSSGLFFPLCSHWSWSSIALRSDRTGNGRRVLFKPSNTHFKNLGNRGYLHGKRERPAKKTGLIIVYKDSPVWEKRPLPDGPLRIPACQSLHTHEGTSKGPVGGIIHPAYPWHGRLSFFNSTMDCFLFQEKKA